MRRNYQSQGEMTKGHDKGHKGQMSDREAMKLALQALGRSMEAGMTGIKVDQAITALRQALEQEPWDTTDMAFRPSWLRDEDGEILEAVRRELDRGNQDGNAPGHGHEVPGIWDSDNGARAGKPCAWCLTWKKFTTIIDREATLKDKKK